MRLKEQARLEKEVELQKIKDCRELYNQKLLRKYILGTFFKLREERNLKNQKADTQNLKQVKKWALTKLKLAVEIQVYEKE